MLTDDEITARLSDAYNEATAGLEYSGRVPSPRRRIAPYAAGLALPVAAATIAVVAVGNHSTEPGKLALPTTGRPGTSASAPAASSSPRSSAAASPEPRLVSRTYKIAGRTLTVRQKAGTAPILQGKCDPSSDPTTTEADLDCYVAIESLVKASPDDTPVDIPGLPGAGIGVDQQTGEAALFVMNSDGTKLFELLSNEHTKQQLINLAKSMSAH